VAAQGYGDFSSSLGYDIHAEDKKPAPPPAPAEPEGLSIHDLAKHERVYHEAVSNAVQLRAQYDIAKKDAVTKKMELENFKKQRDLAQTVGVHKRAAYLEMQRSAAEARRAKAEQKTAEINAKSSSRRQEHARQQQQRAHALALRAARDRQAALREVQAAAGIQMGKPLHSGHAVKTAKASTSPTASTTSTQGNKAPGNSGSYAQQYASLLKRMAHSKHAAQAAAHTASNAVADAKGAASVAFTNPAHAAVRQAQAEEAHARKVVQHSETAENEAESEYKRLMGEVASGRHPSPHTTKESKAIAQDVVARIFHGAPHHD